MEYLEGLQFVLVLVLEEIENVDDEVIELLLFDVIYGKLSFFQIDQVFIILLNLDHYSQTLLGCL